MKLPTLGHRLVDVLVHVVDSTGMGSNKLGNILGISPTWYHRVKTCGTKGPDPNIVQFVIESVTKKKLWQVLYELEGKELILDRQAAQGRPVGEAAIAAKNVTALPREK